MTSFGLCLFLYALHVEPQNINLDHYDVVPPLGRVTSIAASQLEVYVLTDNYLLILERPALTLKRTVFFEPAPDLAAYDPAGDLWLASGEGLIRYNLTLGSIREYPFSGLITAVACGLDKVYLQAGRNYSLDKITGKYLEAASFPGGLKWSRILAEGEARQYPYLMPYYFVDDLSVSQSAETRFPITAICDDGLELFVGTRGYGILKYNTISGQKQRVIYGPLDLDLRQARKMGDRFFFLNGSGISRFDPRTGEWDYRRLNVALTDFFPLDSSWVVAGGSTISYLSGNMVFPIDRFNSMILTAAVSPRYFYVGTGTGLFRIERGTSEAMAFGPHKQAVFSIASVGDMTYAGTDRALFRYRTGTDQWDLIFPRGVKKIIPLGPAIFFLSLDNQLIKFQPGPGDTMIGDSSWVLLPYFNIYDIETDGAVLYCAAYNGLNYYEPGTGLIKPVYGLPRQKYGSVLVADRFVFCVGDRLLYRLPLSYRD
jgi:hypothetical protein